jgi:hypothetical protein
MLHMLRAVLVLAQHCKDSLLGSQQESSSDLQHTPIKRCKRCSTYSNMFLASFGGFFLESMRYLFNTEPAWLQASIQVQRSQWCMDSCYKTAKRDNSSRHMSGKLERICPITFISALI